MKELVFLNLLLATVFTTHGQSSDQGKHAPGVSYRVETIQTPEGLTSATGALQFMPDGRLVACFLRGEVMIYDPASRKWSLFAEGLQEPLGILVVNNSEILVMQRPELTRIKDTDGDGHADLYETVTDDFGISGNYHEFNYGPLKDKEGNLFIGLNSSSANGTVRSEVRGKLDTLTLNQKGQMFSAVPYRGWIMKLTTNGNLVPYASGFRSPNGLGFDLNGNLFAADNQGDWVGSSAFYHVLPGRFYGHPASLVWEAGWNRGNPLLLPVRELEKMKKKAAVVFPHGIIANSPSQPLCDDTRGKFGPYGGQFFVGEMNQERIVRVMVEEVDGELQGACTPFIDQKGLQKGNNRLAFAPDGSLWVGQAIEQGWAGDKGIQRVVFTGMPPMDIMSMHLTKTGFELNFTQEVDEKVIGKLDNFKFKRYNYEYHSKYGSEQFNVSEVAVTKIDVAPGGKKVMLQLESLQPGFVYQLNLKNVKSRQGKPLENNIICYTVNKLRPAQ